MPVLLTAFRDHLVTAGLVRKPAVAGAAPPLWLEPKLGVPAPGEARSGNATEVDQDLVLGAFITGGFAPQPFGSWHRRPIVEIRFRGLSAQTIESTEMAITKELIDRRDWMMGGVQHVIECQQWRALQRVGSDEQGFEFLTSYVFELLRP